MTFESYARGLVRQWEEGKRTADEVVREIRTALAEEAEIREAEAREAS